MVIHLTKSPLLISMENLYMGNPHNSQIMIESGNCTCLVKKHSLKFQTNLRRFQIDIRLCTTIDTTECNWHGISTVRCKKKVTLCSVM